MEFKVKEEVIQKVLNYLANKPFIEVAPLIEALQKIEKIVEKKDDKKKD